MPGLAENAARELFESAGDNIGEKTRFQKYVAAFLCRKLGQGGAFGVVRGLEIALTTAAEKLGGRYIGLITDGFLDGLGDSVRQELNRIKGMEEGARNAHLDQVLGGGKVSDDRGDRKAAPTAKPANDEPVSLFDAIAALPTKPREKAETFVGWLHDAHTDILGGVVHLQTRPGFTRRFLARVTGIEDVALIVLSVKELIVEEVLKMRKEAANKPLTFRERLHHASETFQGGVDALFDEMGLDHAPDDAHGHHLPAPASPLTIVRQPPAPSVPAGTRGDNWNKLKNRLGH